MTLWTAAEAAAATGGKTQGNWEVTGVSIDTRSLAPGDLFVALKGVRDGHDFVAQALEKGAAAAMVSRVPEGVDPAAPLLIVDDVLGALERLGAAGRARTKARVAAITGSVGKTSAKEMLRDALTGQGRVHAAEASFNNHWGVPLTLARMPADTEFAVIEIGMNHPGEIAPLSRLARPHVALVTTVAAAHLEAFANLEGIAHEKASIFEGLEPGGIAIFNGDIDTTAILRATAERVGTRTESFGAKPENDLRLVSVDLYEDATVVRAEIGGELQIFRLETAGGHFATTGLAVLGVAQALGADVTLAARALGQWQPPAGRGTREALVLDPVEGLTLTLLDDAFNANPTSMAAALEVLAVSTPRDGVGRFTKGRRIAVLGDMLELGETEQALHEGLADLPALGKADVVHCVGPRMKALWARLPAGRQGVWVEAASDLAGRIHTLIDAGDVLLIKGSKGSKVSLVVDAIRKLGHPAET